jgi:hypothetical protein
LSASGLLSGATSAQGTFSFVVSLLDANDIPGATAYTLTVNRPAAHLALPAVYPAAPQAHGSTTAGFSGSVDPEGLATTAQFQYGLDPRYTGGGPVAYTVVTPEQPVGSDMIVHAVSATVSGLVPNAVYHVRLVATSSAGTTVGPDQTFRTPSGPPAATPALGQSVIVTPVSGLVFIKPAGSGGGADDQVTAPGTGQGFVPLTEVRNIPSGSQIDARRGTLWLGTASGAGAHSKLQKVTITGGVFQFAQRRAGSAKGLTTLSLLEGAFPGAPSYAQCPKPAADGGPAARAARASPKILQTLKATDNHGRFRTQGRYSSATVRGTQWITEDRCDGTLTIVTRGTVEVYDNGLRKTVTVPADHRYLARAGRT